MLLVDMTPGSFEEIWGIATERWYHDGKEFGGKSKYSVYVTIPLWDEHAMYGSLRLWMYIKGLIVVCSLTGSYTRGTGVAGPQTLVYLAVHTPTQTGIQFR